MDRVGAFAGSPSAYGTFDQAGNVSEWNDASYDDVEAGFMIGNMGAYFLDDFPIGSMSSSYRTFSSDKEYYSTGFRVVFVPEPGGIILFFTGVVTAILFFRRHWNG
jgi:sulfatase modifying factor 1